MLRFGATENLYGIDAIRTFRQNRPTRDLAREISHLQVITFGSDTASVTLEFCRTMEGIPRLGRQSQLWRKLPEGWRIVSAHVSYYDPSASQLSSFPAFPFPSPLLRKSNLCKKNSLFEMSCDFSPCACEEA